MDPSRPDTAPRLRIAWTDGGYRIELRGQAAGLRLVVFEGDTVLFEDTAPTAAAGARRGREVVAALRRGERPDCERGSA